MLPFLHHKRTAELKGSTSILTAQSHVAIASLYRQKNAHSALLLPIPVHLEACCLWCFVFVLKESKQASQQCFLYNPELNQSQLCSGPIYGTVFLAGSQFY